MSKKSLGLNPSVQRNTIPGMFSQQVKANPSAIALVFGDSQWTYQELDHRSNQLAHKLLSLSPSANPKIGIAIYRSAEMIIGLLAISKIGGAYIPIDPNYPIDRQHYLLEDAQAELLLTDGTLVHHFEKIFDQNIIDIEDAEIYKEFPTTGINTFPDSRDLAYVIFTSGSTGLPKGVLVEHHAVANLVNAHVDFVQQPIERFLYAYSFSFDGSVILIWWTLLSGGTLVMAPEGIEKDIDRLADFIFSQKITQLLTFPSLYQLVLDKIPLLKLATLKSISVAGESCPGKLVQDHHHKLPGVRLFNQYGPTEATVGCTIFETSANHTDRKTAIGKAINGANIYILNEELEKVASGVIGEICIGGVGVARGYHNRLELTAEKFVTLEIDGKKDRIYRSGDLGKILPDGNIDFCGRKDTQVKLRGYRIELGEVEAAIKDIPEIQEAVVVLSDGTAAEQKLIAYYQFKNEKTTLNIRQQLLRQLPEYMVPTTWVQLEAFEFTPAGKIDRSNLPAPGIDRPALNNPYKSAGSALEEYLVKKWETTLGISGIGIQDKFFELGGNSLLAAGFISELQQLFDETIFIVTIFEHPTIEQYSVMLAREYSAAVQRHFGQNDSTQTDPGISMLESDEIKAFIKYVPERAVLPSATPQNDQAIFILAPPRSGTSLLRTMLSGHPQIFAANELQLLHFSNMNERAAAYQGKFSLWKEGLVRCLMELEDCTADEAKSTIQDWEENALSTAAVFSLLQQKTKGAILLDKSPSYALDYNALIAAQRTFKNAKFIQLSRHPYAMINSFDRMHMDQVMYLKEQPFRGKQLGEQIWHHSHQQISNFFAQLPKAQQISLTYEDLVTQPERQAKALCEFLNIDYHPDVIAPYKDIEQKMTDGIYGDSKPMGDINFLVHGKIKAEFAEGWKKIKDVELHEDTKALAAKLNYEFKEETAQASEEATINENDIAIIGMHLQVPGANNIDEFWHNLKNEVDVSRAFTDEEILAAGVSPEDLQSGSYIKRGMVLDDHDTFDEKFFGYTPKEAALMDPQHRIFLQVAYGALEDAGINPANVNGKIGVYGGVARNTYLVNNVMTHPQYFDSLDDFQIGIALEKDFPATKVAYKLNLKGPAVNFQTACSSSGVAIHMACQSLRNKDADIMLVGGGRIQPPVDAGYLHKDGHALSPTGFCHTFDAAAEGMVRGQGMSFIVLKKLDQALKDGDRIRAVIKGSAINNDGADKIGFTAPSTTGQTAAIVEAYKNAQIDPTDVSYIEAHGTGTTLGDPIEVAALTKAFQQWTDKKQYCAIASVKSNVGHLDAGACVLGVIKTVLSLENEMLPASMHFSNPNPQINFKGSPFFVNQQLKDWKRSSTLRYAGVSSLGLGGTNVHIVLGEAPQSSIVNSDENNLPQLITLSAKTADALTRQQEQLKVYLENNSKPDLASISFTLNAKRQKFAERTAFVAKDKNDLLQQLNAAAEEITQSKFQPKSFVFLFPGGGAQHTNMGRELYEQEGIFRIAVDECLQLVNANHGYDFKDVLYPSDHRDRLVIEDPLAGITLLFTIEYATAKLWAAWGIKPAAMIGHSLGEYTAACLAGVFSLEDALKMVVARGELFLELPEGGMLSIGLPPAEVKILIGDRLDIAAINRPDHCVVSGSKESIDQVKEELNQLEIHATRPKINVAAHSREIDVILDRFKAVLNTIDFYPAQQKMIANLQGDWAAPEDFSNVDYWLNHLRHTVLFSDGIEKLFNAEENILLEVGPGQTLATFSRQHKNKPQGQSILASLPHPKESTSDLTFMLQTLGKIWCLGAYDQWNLFYQYKPKNIASLPTYPFAKNRHWIAAKPKISLTPIHQPVLTMSTPPINTDQNGPPEISRQQLILSKLKHLLHNMSGIPVAEMSNQATFLEMGFDSLFLTQAVSKIKKEYKIKLSFRQLFDELPNLGTLSNWLDQEVDTNLFQDELKTAQQATAATNAGNTPQAKPNLSFNLPQQLQNLQGQATGDLAKIIEQQLRLMEQQLYLLSGGQLNTGAQQSPAKNYNDSDLGKTQALKSNKAPIDIPKNVVSADAFREINKTSGQKKPARNISSWEDLDERETKYLKELIQRYTSRTKGSQQLTSEQRKHLADPRSISGFNKIWKDMVYQIAMVRSKGSRMWDVDENEYIDYRSSFGCSLFGHSPAFVEKAIQDQLSKGYELGALTPLAKQVADLLCELSGMERITIVNTGSEALSAAIRCARTVSGREKIAVFEGDYHGIADELLVRSVNRNGVSTTVPVSPGIPSSLVQNVIVLHYDDPNVLQVIEEHADELAGIMIEPIQPNNPTFQPKTLIHQIRAITRKHDIALIFDEMITGFRLAPRGAQEWYDVKADLVAYGKIISGGLPMAALAGKAKYLDAFDGGQWQFGDDSTPPAGVTFFGGTFVRHPLGLASALAALTMVKEGGQKIYTDLNERSLKFAQDIAALIDRTKAPLKVLASASIITIKSTDHNPFAPLFFYHCRLKGIHMTSKAALVTLAHSPEDLDKTLAVFEAVIGEMQTAGFFPITVQEFIPEHEIIPMPVKRGIEKNPIKIEIPNQRIGDIVTEQRGELTLPLTPGQKEVWIEHRLSEEAAAAYNLAGKIELSGSIDVAILQASVNFVVERHEALRSKFNFETPTQTILPNVDLIVEKIDLSTEQDIDQQIESICEKEGSSAFDLFNGPLIRFKWIKKSAAESVLIITAHHGIADGWSCGIIAKEISQIYTALMNKEKPNLAPANSYVDYINEETAFLDSEEYQENAAYWKAIFEDAVPILEFPQDAPRPIKKTYDADLESIHLEAALIDDLKKVASAQGTTLFILLYNAYRIFIHRYSHQDDFVLGLVAAAQTISGNENLVTHGVSLLPVRNKITKKASFSDDLKATRNLVLDAFDHQRYTLGSLVQSLNIKRDPSRQPIISFLFNMDAEGATLNFGGIPGLVQPIQRKYETFDTFINVKSVAQGIDFEWIFNTDLFDKTIIQLRLESFRELLTSIAENPEQSIDQINIIGARELKIKSKFHSERMERDRSKTFLHYFREKVKEKSRTIAVQSGGKKLSYQELEEDTNRLAQRLLQNGAQKGDHVGIYFERSLDMIIAMIATFKVGGIYVPIDPVNPQARCQLLLEDVGANFLLTHTQLKDRQPKGNWKTIFLNGPNSDWKNAPSEPIAQDVQGTDLAYVIYTSGSSGKPKSVSIPHYAVVDHHLSIQTALDVKASDHFLSVASIAFDPSVQDYFLPLMAGAKVTIATRDEQLDGRLMGELINRENITLMQATPATWRLLLLSGWQGSKELVILSGGEGLNRTFADDLLSKCKRLYNIYGPTETTIWSTLHEVIPAKRLPSVSGFEPVGKPITNVQLYLLDDSLQEVPLGATGELYIGGVGVAPAGYLKHPDLNAFHFVNNPFHPKERLYRTGDIAKYLINGDLEFLGRKDGQVKIRGHRIEIGEIETYLSKVKEIKENVVVAKQNPAGEKSLVAYVTLSNGKPLDIKEAKKYLQEELPAYMIPQMFVTLPAFPLTNTQKIDRKKLPEPNWELIKRPSLEQIAPETPSEKMLYGIWQQILNLESFSIKDDFFELGGHSLIAVNLMAKIENETGKRLPLSTLLEHPTIEQLGALLEGEKDSEYTRSMVPIRPEGSKPPIYLVHGAGLHVLMYQTLADHMCPEQPIFGFQARGLYGEAEPLDRIEDMAAAYIEEILERNPDGPYALAGYSFGGLITFEMAKQLKAMGKEVVMLGMFDTVVRPEITGEKWSYYQSLKRIGKKVAWNLGAIAKDPIHNFKYKTNTLSRRLKRFTWSMRNVGAELSNENDVNKNMGLLDQKNKTAFEHYRISPFDGKIHLFRAKVRRFWIEDFNFLGWKPFARQGIVVHEVPGDHLNLFSDPNGKDFAKILQAVLDELFEKVREERP